VIATVSIQISQPGGAAVTLSSINATGLTVSELGDAIHRAADAAHSTAGRLGSEGVRAELVKNDFGAMLAAAERIAGN
jgi:hypothetical protein